MVPKQSHLANIHKKIAPILLSRLQGKYCLWEEAEKWYMDRLTTEPQIFSVFKEINLKTRRYSEKTNSV